VIFATIQEAEDTCNSVGTHSRATGGKSTQ
jgi:hypothetical protein